MDYKIEIYLNFLLDYEKQINSGNKKAFNLPLTTEKTMWDALNWVDDNDYFLMYRTLPDFIIIKEFLIFLKKVIFENNNNYFKVKKTLESDIEKIKEYNKIKQKEIDDLTEETINLNIYIDKLNKLLINEEFTTFYDLKNEELLSNLNQDYFIDNDGNEYLDYIYTDEYIYESVTLWTIFDKEKLKDEVIKEIKIKTKKTLNINKDIEKIKNEILESDKTKHLRIINFKKTIKELYQNEDGSTKNLIKLFNEKSKIFIIRDFNISIIAETVHFSPYYFVNYMVGHNQYIVLDLK